ncbi:ski2-like helicase [Nocardioides dokdonensis FR1436]|uniref:Ski2-like helicase n=1 Tax=Nocardioides dokdonensis FR1436 TaxID=1300347 RepID=A0A1A9GPT8_9ACTN|nr:DEAD/DEAH box helicase [Nocardioides dokdonensis]ANH39491.1 ski2-like helicase [Nocardioides dokdonensis FR1436]
MTTQDRTAIHDDQAPQEGQQPQGFAWPRVGADDDAVYDAVTAYAATKGLELYPHQDEAVLELLAGSNVVLATPTGSGKSLVALAAHATALADDRVSFYTAPIKALVSEKFFDLCTVFGAENVGMLTGDAAVNVDAPIICCTAEVLANLALREGRHVDVGLVVMDEFHYYGEPERGWAWQVPLLELPQAQFLLMSATLGDLTELGEDLTRRNGRETAIVDDAERPVPLSFTWSLDPLPERLEEIVTTGQAPVYVVHFTQAAAVEHATSLLNAGWIPKPTGMTERLAGTRFGPGFGKTLSKLLKRGVGVHHAGMLPRYRRLVEQLAQAGELSVICGTDTLGVGINVPIRTVLFTGLAKFDGTRQRVLRTREFLQIAGRAGRAGFDTAGYVVVQAPEHTIENEKAKAKAAAKNAAMSEEKQAKRKSKAQLRKPPEGTVVWTEQTFDKLVAGEPEQLMSRMKIDNSMILNVLSRDEDAFAVLRRLLTDNHEDPRAQRRLSLRALRLARSLVTSGVVVRLDPPDEHGRRYRLTHDLPPDFALNQPLAHFAMEAFEVLTPPEESGDPVTHALDVVSVVEAVLDSPRQVLMAQQWAARGEAVNEMKADGIEYEERMALLEEISWPQPLAELLGAAYEAYRGAHPWLPEDALDPKSVVRQMYEQGMSFTDLVGRYQLARSEGLVLRYLTDAYRTLRQSVPEQHRSEELEELVEWLGETVRQTDSSLLDEWEALSDPEGALARLGAELTQHAPPPPPRPLTQQGRSFEVMVRNAMFRRVELVARDDLDGLMALERAAADRTDPAREVVMGRSAWDSAIEEYYAEHDSVDLGPDSRGPKLLLTSAETGVPAGLDEDAAPARLLRVRQTVHDPAGDHDWVIDAVADLDATDELGELVLPTVAFHRL